jgi:hypothetical protein
LSDATGEDITSTPGHGATGIIWTYSARRIRYVTMQKVTMNRDQLPQTVPVWRPAVHFRDTTLNTEWADRHYTKH